MQVILWCCNQAVHTQHACIDRIVAKRTLTSPKLLHVVLIYLRTSVKDTLMHFYLNYCILRFELIEF